jgi:uncharacterized protein YjdB
MFKSAKRVTALLTSALMALSCGIAEPLSEVFGAVQSIVASADVRYPATKINIYDEYEKDISENPIIYLDNSAIAGGSTSTTVRVKIANTGSVCDDTIAYAETAGQTNICTELLNKTSDSITLKIAAEKVENDKTVSLSAGTTYVYFTTLSGEVYRALTVVVYDPAEDMRVYFNDKKTEISFEKSYPLPDKSKLTLNNVQAEYDKYGASDYVGSVMAVANHKYQMYGVISGSSTEKVEWQLYDGDYSEIDLSKPGSTKAEITEDGLLTPKSNGIVTLVAKAKATETSERTYANVKKTAKATVMNGDKEVSVSLDYTDHTLVKYISVLVVKENPAKTMKITNGPGAMESGESIQLNLEKTPTYTGSGYETGATDVIRWESSNTKVATVDQKGLVTAVGKGDVTITAYGENENVSARTDIKVLTKATSISISPSPASTRVGVSIELTATMSPTTADDEIEWSTDSPNVTVKSTTTGELGNVQTAVVTGVNVGQAIVTAKAKNSGVEAKVTVTVNSRKTSNELTLSTTRDDVLTAIPDGSTVSVYTNKDIKIDAELLAADGSTPDDTIAWEISGINEFVTQKASTAKSVTLHGIGAGTVTVKAYSESNPTISQTIYVQVLRACDKVTLYDTATDKTCSSKSLNVGDSFSLYTVLTADKPHSDVIVSWTSSNESVATVSSTGVVVAQSTPGTSATITATSASGVKATCTVKVFTTSELTIGGVTAATNDIDLPTLSLTLPKTGSVSKALSLTIKDQNFSSVSGAKATWTSSDEGVATVDSDGKVTATDVGTTVITARSGTKSDQCLVVVTGNSGQAEIAPIESMIYSPLVTEYTPVPVVTFNGKTLVEDVDYTVEYSNNTKIGTGTVTITGIGTYSGKTTAKFTIAARPVNDSDVVVSTIDKQECTGSKLTPDVTVTCLGRTLVSGTDYTVKYTDNTKPGTASVTITGKGNYRDSVVTTFTIYCNHTEKKKSRDLTKATCTTKGTAEYKCTACQQTFEVATDLADHTYSTAEVTKKATCTVAGTKVYTCKVCGKQIRESIPATGHSWSTSWTIDKQATCSAAGSKSQHCKNCDSKQNVTAIAKTAHTYTTTVVAPTLKAKGYTLHKCKVCSSSYKDSYTAKLINVSSCKVSGLKSSYAATGKAIVPSVTVKYGSKKLSSGTDYTITAKNNVTAGIGTLTITGKGKYGGTKSVKFKIAPKKVTGVKLANAKTKQLKATWTKDSNATGYQVILARNSKFTIGKKTVKITKNGTTSKLYTGLSKGKTYYVKVRAYKKVGSTIIWGAWSSYSSKACK